MWIFYLLLPIAGMTYAAWHVWQLLPLAPVWRWLAAVATFVLPLMALLGVSRTIERMPLPVARAVYEVGDSALFVLLYMVMGFLVLDLGRLVRIVPKAWLYSNALTAALLAAILVVVFVAGNLHYQHKERIHLSINTEKTLQRPLRVVMVSDVHLGYHNRRAALARWVDMINAEHPDVVLIAGDLVDISLRPLRAEGMDEELRRLQAPVYACLGNHEYYAGVAEATDFFRQSGITLLRDSTASVAGITLVGRDDRTNVHRQNLNRLMRGVDLSRPVVLLDHQPYHLEQAERSGVDLQLSGHTHRGQVWPISWITDALYEVSYGEWQRGATRYYVSSGLGIWGGKFRIGTCSEYVVVDINR